MSPVYKQIPAVLRAIRRIQIDLDLPFVSPWMSSWKYDLHGCETVIIPASRITPPVVRFIAVRHPSVRIIVWYSNPVDKSVRLDRFSEADCEIWSFDEEDCKRYGLKYNTQYYFNDIPLQSEEYEFDVFFVGGDKGRIEDLIRIHDVLRNLGVTSYFHITSAGKASDKYRDVYRKRIPYSQVIRTIARCRAILDFVSEGQSGLTLRPLEALFFRKKLITNDTRIMDREFYRRENIFVYGKDSLDGLPGFLSTPYQTVEEEILNKYDFDAWLERFFG